MYGPGLPSLYWGILNIPEMRVQRLRARLSEPVRESEEASQLEQVGNEMPREMRAEIGLDNLRVYSLGDGR